MLRSSVFAALLAAAGTPVGADAQPRAISPPLSIRLLLDCVDTFCDQDYLQTELTFVDHVRTRQDADVHVLVTSQPAGGGGQEITFAFIGQGRFSGQQHTLRHATLPGEPDDALRRDMLRILSVGLGPFILASPVDAGLILIPRSDTPAAAQPAADPWNSWTFRVQFNGNGTAEESTRFSGASGSFNANRTTEASRINFSLTGSYSQSSFDLPDEERFVSSIRRYAANTLYAKSLGGHWSLGVRGALTSASFENLDSSWYLTPAVEFDVFPYRESTRRLLTVEYAVGVRAFNYEEETLFGKLTEQTGAHALNVSLTLRQPWGTASSGIDAASFLPDVRHNRASAWGDVDFNLVRGLSVSLSGEVRVVRDQVFLPRRGATTEEVLVRQKQLPTDFQVFYTFGFSYTFGSIYSPVVNPRLRRGGF